MKKENDKGGRERLGSRLGFIMLSAGCAIGCGNVWKFPWMCGEYGGGSFVAVYILCLLVLGLPVMTMEFSMGRAAQASPLYMFRKLGKGHSPVWKVPGALSLLGNVALMAFYTVVAGWILNYFFRFVTGQTEALSFGNMISNPWENVIFTLVTVAISFAVLSFSIQGGLERITKYMMVALLLMMLVMLGNSLSLPGAGKGMQFYLVPDFSKFSGETVVKAMNQAFFTLSVGIGSMAIFGSYIGKDRSLMGEAGTVIALDTLVALLAGAIIFPACFSYGVEVTEGPGLLFDTMAYVFLHMAGGRWWGALFFLFMVFAAFSTVLAVCENILAMAREMFGWSRKKGSLLCGAVVFLLSLTTALGYSVLKFQPFAEGTAWLDFWDFIVSTNILPLGSLFYALFCCNRFGWGWDAFMAEANTGRGLKVKSWMKPLFRFAVPVLILFLYVYGLATFRWR